MPSVRKWACDNSAKKCRGKVNNLNQKYEAVKDKSIWTGEDSEETKSFPQFDDLDQIWGTRDFVSLNNLVEAGTSQPVTSTPNSSICGSERGTTVPLAELDKSTDESDLAEEQAAAKRQAE